MSEGPSVGDILVGIFIILFGGCITLAGGACTVMLANDLSHGSGGGGSEGLLLLLSLAILALGLFLAWIGFKMMTGRYRK